MLCVKEAFELERAQVSFGPAIIEGLETAAERDGY
jgi:hypothetical protein